MLDMDKNLREAEKVRIIRRSSNSGGADDPIVKDKVLEETLRYTP